MLWFTRLWASHLVQDVFHPEADYDLFGQIVAVTTLAQKVAKEGKWDPLSQENPGRWNIIDILASLCYYWGIAYLIFSTKTFSFDKEVICNDQAIRINKRKFLMEPMTPLGVKGPSACNEDFGMKSHLFFHRLEYFKKDMLFPTDEISLITHFKWGGIMFWNRSLLPLIAYLILVYFVTMMCN